MEIVQGVRDRGEAFVFRNRGAIALAGFTVTLLTTSLACSLGTESRANFLATPTPTLEPGGFNNIKEFCRVMLQNCGNIFATPTPGQ